MKKYDIITKSILEINQLKSGEITPKFIDPAPIRNQVENFNGIKINSTFCGMLNLHKDTNGNLIPRIFIPSKNKISDIPYVYKHDPRFWDAFKGF